jgi:hypothetical protein
MNRVKLLSAAALLLTAFAGPALAEGGHGHGGGGMAMGGGSGGSVAAAPSGGAAVAPSGGAFSGGARSSANVTPGSMVRGDSGRNFAAKGGRGDWRGDGRHEHHGRDGRFAIGAGFGYPYGYDSYAYFDGDCYLVRRRVMTPYGWRLRRVQVCE